MDTEQVTEQVETDPAVTFSDLKTPEEIVAYHQETQAHLANLAKEYDHSVRVMQRLSPNWSSSDRALRLYLMRRETYFTTRLNLPQHYLKVVYKLLDTLKYKLHLHATLNSVELTPQGYTMHLIQEESHSPYDYTIPWSMILDPVSKYTPGDSILITKPDP